MVCERSDGTPIAIERSGSGRPVIFVGGAFNDRSSVAGLAAALASSFTAVTYDRRGRGDSGGASEGDDRGAREHEFDDLAAVIAAVGGRASLFGHSSGGVSRPRGRRRPARSRHRPGRRSTSRPTSSRARAPYQATTSAAGSARSWTKTGATTQWRSTRSRRSGCRRSWSKGCGTDMWGWLTTLAPSLACDCALYDPGFGPPRDRLATIAVPTLAVAGSNTFESLRAATRAVAEAIPNARFAELDGEDHGILQRPAALAPLMADFLS